MSELQVTRDVFMVRPTRFMGNSQTAGSNRFQQLSGTDDSVDAQLLAGREFASLVTVLTDAGIRVNVFDDTSEPHTPDSLFPNNWVSFHADGTVVLYPMLAPNRRLERRMDILESLSIAHGFTVRRIVDLTYREAEGKYLEGTGSLVLDRVNHVAYACLSPRTDPEVLGEFAQQLDYELVAFTATDGSRIPIYHTNVMMSVGTRFAAVCSAALGDADRTAVLSRLRATGREILKLSLHQMSHFAGNMLELSDTQGAGAVFLSEAGFRSLDAGQVDLLRHLGMRVVAVPVPTIERLGGGSVRCMIAEIHLPRREQVAEEDVAVEP